MATIDDILELDQIDSCTFSRQRVWGVPTGNIAFGGHLAGLALAAAFRTVGDDKIARSMHVLFASSAERNLQVVFKVQSLDTGGRIHSRTVSCFQKKRLVLEATCNFTSQRPPEYQAEYTYQRKVAPSTPVFGPGAEYVLDDQGSPDAFPSKAWVTRADNDQVGTAAPHQHMWLECPARRERTLQMEQCIVAAYSDVNLTRVILRPYGIHRIVPPPPLLRKSLSMDHHIWFHQRVDPASPMLIDAWCSQLVAGRGLVQAEVYTHDGRLGATVVQEARVELDATSIVLPQMPKL